MVDRDLADLYGVSTKRLNEQVKRNAERFPNDYMFPLSMEETHKLVAKCDQFKNEILLYTNNPFIYLLFPSKVSIKSSIS